MFALACAAFAQTPAFEVASVKPSRPQSSGAPIGATIDAQNVRISNFSLFNLMLLAYQVKPHQVSGPAWMTTETYDIQAKLPEGGRRDQVPAMLQTLLAQRFGLRVHRETREFNVYALVVDKSGPRMKPSSAGEAPPTPNGVVRGGVTGDARGGATYTSPTGDSRVSAGPGGSLHIECSKMTMLGLANLAGRYRDRPVVDQTGLAGAYDFELDVSAEDVRDAARAYDARPSTPDPSGVSLDASLRKLGLKLESRKAPAEVIVVDKVEKVPVEN